MSWLILEEVKINKKYYFIKKTVEERNNFLNISRQILKFQINFEKQKTSILKMEKLQIHFQNIFREIWKFLKLWIKSQK